MRTIASGVLLCVLVAGTAHAQAVRIRTAGNLLGQVEGFCDYPGGPYDWYLSDAEKTEKAARLKMLQSCADNLQRPAKWLGGILGLDAALGAPKINDLLILTGNNIPARHNQIFTAELLKLKPAMIAVGPEDLLRLVRAPGSTAQSVFAWARGSAQPLIASNLAIHTSVETGDLNVIELATEDYEVHLDLQSSVSWLSSLKVGCPAGRKLTARLFEFDAKPKREESGTEIVKPKVGNCVNGADATVTFPTGLRPNRWYRLIIEEGGFDKAIAVFQTDAALTPAAANTGELAGFPALYRADIALLLTSLIDPSQRDRAADPNWVWKEAGSSHELVVLDPQKTLATMLARATVKNGLPPNILLASSLDDATMTALFDKRPEIRFVVLPPESGLLGRAAPEVRPDDAEKATKTRYSGDQGFVGIIDALYDEATRVMVRPEWFGETLIDVEATFATKSDARSIKVAKVNVDVVAGAELKTSVSGPDVIYSALLDSTETIIERTAFYRNCPKDPAGQCKDFTSIWTDGLMAAIGDAVRGAADADLSLVSQDIVDTDYQDYVKTLVGSLGTGVVSRYVLERLVYESPRMVRATVPGAKIFETLVKALKADPALCISGAALACPATIDEKHPERLRINDRIVNPLMYYAIALPDELAEELGLPHDDNLGSDIVSAFDDYLKRAQWQLPGPGTGPLSERLEALRNQRADHFISVPTLDFGFVLSQPRDPENRTGVRQALGLEFSGATKNRILSLTLESDSAVIDEAAWALRIPASIKLARKNEVDVISYDSDAFSIGGRADWKLKLTRIYGGTFFDGQLRPRPGSVTASRPLPDGRDGFSSTETATFSLKLPVEPRRYWYGAAGVDFIELREFPISRKLSMNLKRLGTRAAFGEEYNVPTGLVIGDVTQSLDDLRTLGAQKLLNSYFAEHVDTLTSETPIAITLDSPRLTRWEGDADIEVKLKQSKEHTGQVLFRHRQYWYPAGLEALSLLTRDTRIELRFAFSLWGRLKATPSYLYQRAKTQADDRNIFTYHRFELKLSAPFVWRFGRGGLLR
ncbi:MAG TPA: hypothetical protein VFV98_10185 [Vicinamibacterales bacterium]|nr:hypothetical protein [Vicinamibacterales bacterium]